MINQTIMFITVKIKIFIFKDPLLLSTEGTRKKLPSICLNRFLDK